VQAHVNARSDPRRADDPPVVHEAAVGVNRRLRGGLAQEVDGPWCVVASVPSSRPAFAKSSAPVQTERTSSSFVDACLIQSISIGLCISLRVP
jgi:hypothetical protein